MTSTIQLSNLPWSSEQQDSVADALLEYYSHAPAYSLIPNAKEVLAALSERDILIGVITNTDPRIKQILKEHSLDHHFSFILDAYTAGFSKPHQAIFLQAMKQSGLSSLKPDEVLHIGDSLAEDYLGSQEAGWKSILVSSQYKEQCAKRNIPVSNSSMFTSLEQMMPRVLSMLS